MLAAGAESGRSKRPREASDLIQRSSTKHSRRRPSGRRRSAMQKRSQAGETSPAEKTDARAAQRTRQDVPLPQGNPSRRKKRRDGCWQRAAASSHHKRKVDVTRRTGTAAEDKGCCSQALRRKGKEAEPASTPLKAVRRAERNVARATGSHCSALTVGALTAGVCSLASTVHAVSETSSHKSAYALADTCSHTSALASALRLIAREEAVAVWPHA